MMEDETVDRVDAIDEPVHARAQALKGLAIALPAALAACGGGSDGGGGLIGGPGAANGPGDVASDAGPHRHAVAANDEEAARFLLQAQFSASDAEIAAVRTKGYLGWLNEQFAAPRSEATWEWLNARPYNSTEIDDAVWRHLMTGSDAVRMRCALALSEIFVISANELDSSWPHHMLAHYWDTLVGDAFGNFRQLLEDVTLNPTMGFFLNTRGNQKENAKGRQPDENYAREVMQLMTVGLFQLNPDGSVKTGADGQPLPTYVQDEVSQLARVFTGYDLDIKPSEQGAFRPPGASTSIETNAWTRRPMAFTASRHSMLEAKFLGATVPANTPGPAALKIALDTLFNHPNVGPFIGRQLIQRLVTSNPSPAYIQRVAAAFANNGAGVRGDMKAVFTAVLLDDEARGPAGLTDPFYGHLREPMVRLVQWGRTFGLTSTSGNWGIGTLDDVSWGLAQSPFRAPSVFNFFRPGYVPPSTVLAANQRVAPEFQIVNEASVGGYLNCIQDVLRDSVDDNGDMKASYTAEKAVVLDRTALVKRINLLLTANQLSSATVTLITNALASPALTAASSDDARLDRIAAAVLLVMATPEYLVQK